MGTASQRRWGMIADDLTGACDAGAAFAAQGFETRVLLEPWPAVVKEADLTVVSTESRDDASDDAKKKVADACRWMGERNISVLFKKIDSVLRGNIEAEVAAVMNACGFGSAVVTPAFPAMGRTVRQGALRVFGKQPDYGPDLETMFLSQAAVSVEDAETDEDLTAIAEAALARKPVPLLVGSGGLAGPAARTLARRCGKPASDGGSSSLLPAGIPRSRLPIWLVIGSRHPSTMAQLAYLEEKGLFVGAAELVLLRVPVEAFDENAVRPAAEAFQRGMVGALVLSGGDTARLLCGALAADAIHLDGEVLPGIPWGRLEGGLADGTTVVTKSGGFGGPDLLFRVVDSLKEKERV